MSHIIHLTEEIEEHGFCQQYPRYKAGDKFLFNVNGEQRLRIVLSVIFDRYVWENVAQWTTIYEDFFDEEYTLLDTRVFVANEMIGVLLADQDLIQGELIICPRISDHTFRGVAPFGFYGCRNLTRVTINPNIVIVYENAFSGSGLRELVFNEEVPVIVHTSAIDGCDGLPCFNTLYERPFLGKYLLCTGKVFREWEEKLYQLHYLHSQRSIMLHKKLYIEKE